MTCPSTKSGDTAASSSSGAYTVKTIKVSPSGKYLAFGTETNEVFAYSMSGVNNFTFLGKGLGHSDPVQKLAWSPDEK